MNFGGAGSGLHYATEQYPEAIRAFHDACSVRRSAPRRAKTYSGYRVSPCRGAPGQNFMTDPMPCPFCGVTAEAMQNGNDAVGNWYVMCLGCKIRTDFHWQRHDAVKRWNERKNEEELRQASLRQWAETGIEPDWPKFSVTVQDDERQMILLALAELSLSRPGWHWTLGNLADRFSGREMFEGFRQTSSMGGKFGQDTKPR
jgi:Lar family restriction alleviation protein